MSGISGSTILLLLGAAVLAGTVRGFSGFGAGMIFVPAASAVVGPKTAVVILWLIDSLPTLPLVIPATRKAEWRSVLPVLAGYAATVWLGVLWLKTGDTETLRWAMSGFIFCAVGMLWSGWRWQGSRPPSLSLAVGALSGFAGGAAQLSGPPVVIYWLAGTSPHWQVRANIIVLFFLTMIVSGVTLLANGLFVREALIASLYCAPVYALALIAGQRLFGHSTDGNYRRIAFVLILVVAFATLPVFGA